MRNRYIVAYDVSDGKRLRSVFKKMNGFGDRVAIFRLRLRSLGKGTRPSGGGVERDH